MKKTSSIILLPMTALILSGCFSSYKSISSDEFKEFLTTAQSEVAVDSDKIDNVSMSTYLGVESYNYKKGEFYRYNYFLFALLIVVSQQECTWKEDGKYYYYSYSSVTQKTVDQEITEEEFNTKMAAHRAKISSKLSEPYVTSLAYIEAPVEGTDVKYSKSSTHYRLIASRKDASSSDSSKTVTYTTTITFKNNLPEKWENKGEGKSYTQYSFGDAEFHNPHDNTEE